MSDLKNDDDDPDMKMVVWCERKTRVLKYSRHFKQMLALKKIISQTDKYLVKLSSKTYVFEDKMTSISQFD